VADAARTGVTTVMVFIMVLIASIFFLVADQLMGWGSC
jgi:preprotein translocase subunit SecE